jgi:hypothetical protein
VSAANDRDPLLGWIWICLSYGGGTGIMEWKIDCRAYKAFVATLVLAAAVFVQFTEKSPAAEDALGTYLLGSKGPQAGMLPPPGIFVTNTLYIYRGDVGVDVEIPNGGKVEVGPDVTLWLMCHRYSGFPMLPYWVATWAYSVWCRSEMSMPT